LEQEQREALEKEKTDWAQERERMETVWKQHEQENLEREQ